MKVTKALRKKCSKLAKLIAKEKKLPKSQLVVDKQVYKDKEYTRAVQGKSENGIRKYLVSCLQRNEMSEALLDHLIKANEKNLLKKSDIIEEDIIHEDLL